MAKTKFNSVEQKSEGFTIEESIVESNNPRIEKTFDDKTYFMEVKQPSILVYRNFSKMRKESYYKAMDTFVNNCIVNASPEVGKDDSLVDDEIKMLFHRDVEQLYFTVKDVEIDINKCYLVEYEEEFNRLKAQYPKIYTIYIDGKALFLRKANRKEYMEIFDAFIDVTDMYAFEHAYNLLKVGGHDLIEPIDFYSAKDALMYIISSYAFDVKKK